MHGERCERHTATVCNEIASHRTVRVILPMVTRPPNTQQQTRKFHSISRTGRVAIASAAIIDSYGMEDRWPWSSTARRSRENGRVTVVITRRARIVEKPDGVSRDNDREKAIGTRSRRRPATHRAGTYGNRGNVCASRSKVGGITRRS